MPKGQPRRALELPARVKIEIITGKALMAVKAAAKLAGIPPAVLEMANTLIEKPGEQAGRFLLGTPEMKTKAVEIEQVFVAGLRKVARAHFGAGKLTVHSTRDGDTLTFWYEVAA